MNDLRHSLRSLLANPGMTVAAILTLALGIGANTAIFSGVNGLFLNPAPATARSSELVEVYNADHARGNLGLSSPEYRDYRDRNDVFSGLLAYSFVPLVLTDGNSHERIWSILVSGNYFDVLGVQAEAGRTLTSEDDAGGGRPVVVISYGLWQRRFAGRADIVGSEVAINGHAFSIVGVAPKEFRGTFPGLVFDAYIPLMNEDRLVEIGQSDNRRSRDNVLVGRLKAGVSPSAAEARLQVIAQDLSRTYPALNAGLSAAVYPLSQSPRGPTELLGSLITVLMGVMGLLLLMTCANVANLLLARAAARQREIAVRLALGAGQWRLTRQLLVESLILAGLGGVAGIGVGYWTAQWLMGFLPEVDAPLDFSIRIDRTVLLFAMLTTTVAAVIFGLLPARQAANTDLVPALKDGGLGAVGAPARSRLRRTLVVVQIAASLVLLVAAGLFIRSLDNAQAVDPGFNPKQVLVATIFLPSPAYDGRRSSQFYQQLVERVGALPDVRSATIARRAPLGLEGSATDDISAEGYAPEADERPWSVVLTISPSYFQTLQIPIVAGRDLSMQDDDQRPPVAMINQPFADRYWPGRDPIGRRVLIQGEWRTVIGVVPMFMMGRLNEPPSPTVFLPVAQVPRSYMTLIVRTGNDPAALAPAVRRIIQDMDATLPLYAVRTLESQVAGSTFAQRAAASLLSVFGMLALLLASVGTYGVVAYNVSQRTREVGIRMALGAEPRQILNLVMGGGFAMIGIGAGAGVAGALVVARLLEPYLIGVGTTDAASIAGPVVLLSAAALVACYLPTRRAMRLDPNIALRHE